MAICWILFGPLFVLTGAVAIYLLGNWIYTLGKSYETVVPAQSSL